MVAASEVSFTRLIKLLLSGGSATRAAWGRIARRNVCHGVIPILAAASHCPLSMDEIAARSVSEVYAAVFSDRPIIAAGIGSSSIPNWGSP